MIKIQALKSEDALMIFNWRNDPFIINQGTLKKKVTWSEHKNWIENSIKKNTRNVFIILVDDKACGQIRFDQLEQKSAVLSIYLIKSYTGKGLGLSAIDLGLTKIFQLWKEVDEVYAFVLKNNTRGYKAFLKAGFNAKPNQLAPPEHHSLVYLRNEKK